MYEFVTQRSEHTHLVSPVVGSYKYARPVFWSTNSNSGSREVAAAVDVDRALPAAGMLGTATSVARVSATREIQMSSSKAYLGVQKCFSNAHTPGRTLQNDSTRIQVHTNTQTHTHTHTRTVHIHTRTQTSRSTPSHSRTHTSTHQHTHK